MWVPLVKATVGRIYRDNVIRYVVLAIIASSAILGVFVGPLVGALVLVTYTSGLVVATLLLNNAKCLQLLVDLFRTSGRASSNGTDCDVCGAVRCSRHKADAATTAWQSLIVDSALDEAVTGFYSHILDSFIQSWLSQFSQDDNFVHLLKQSLRDATCRLVGRLKQLDAPLVITTRLLPCAFSHYEAVTKMLHQDAPVPMHKLALTFIMTDQPLHPAVCNRQSEIRYLRKIATCLMPKLLNADYLESKTVSSLVRELLAVWVLLPLLDVIADPNLLNLLAIVATDPPSHRQFKASSVRVPFLENFVQSTGTVDDATLVDDLLTDQSKLYNFMQFLKREGAVDVLRFHLDVEQLNQELQDPRITTDPAKLSALQQQSEQLLRHYGTMVAKVRELSEAQTLTEAHEITKRLLLGKWRRAYLKTTEHFREVYGERLVREPEDLKSDGVGVGPSAGVPATTKLSKLKGALRVGPIDAAVMSIEAVEAPTVWDAFNDPVPQNAASSLSNAAAQKSSRKERGQHMDHFMGTFMQSIEQSTDYGEDVIQMHKKRGWPVSEERESRVPGKNLVFGDLFELRKPPNGFGVLNYHQHPVRGPSRCLVYILSEIVYIPWKMIIKFVIALSNISRQLVDTAVCFALQKLINMGLYEPRLAVLISLLTELLFGDKKQAEPTAAELLQRQRLARERLVAVNRQLGPLMDVLQSPAMNKHLIYTLFDIICAELFPDVLERVRAEGF